MNSPKTTQLNKKYHVVIVGGGMAGATMAISLARMNLNIALIEAHPYRKQSQPSFDDRALALSWSSRQIFHALDIWQTLENQHEVAAIKRIHISDKGHPGITRLDHQQHHVPALGYVVESRIIGEALIETLGRLSQIEVLNPAQVTRVTTTAEQVNMKVSIDGHSRELEAGLLIIADGLRSSTREMLGIKTNEKTYQQSAIIANVETQKFHQYTAYERFTETGPLAMLPLSQQRCSLVWTTHNDQLEELMNLDDESFRVQLQKRFGYRLGAITRVGQRSHYPLTLMTLDKDGTNPPRTLLIGNAAHGVHPVAGQGFNLGLRDIAVLSELINDALRQGYFEQIDVELLIKHYWQWREKDIRQVTSITDGLICLFSNNIPVLTQLRSTGLLLSDLCQPLKLAIAREAMGLGKLQGKYSKMSLGIPLTIVAEG